MSPASRNDTARIGTISASSISILLRFFRIDIDTSKSHLACWMDAAFKNSKTCLPILINSSSCLKYFIYATEGISPFDTTTRGHFSLFHASESDFSAVLHSMSSSGVEPTTTNNISFLFSVYSRIAFFMQPSFLIREHLIPSFAASDMNSLICCPFISTFVRYRISMHALILLLRFRAYLKMLLSNTMSEIASSTVSRPFRNSIAFSCSPASAKEIADIRSSNLSVLMALSLHDPASFNLMDLHGHSGLFIYQYPYQ